MIPEAAVEAAWATTWDVPGVPTCNITRNEVRAILEAAAPFMAAQVLTDAVEEFPLETISAPDNAVVWLRRRAEEVREAK